MKPNSLAILVLALLAGLFAASSTLAQTSIELRRVVRVQPGQTITLADIAEMRGEGLTSAADLEIPLEEPDDRGWFVIEKKDVRELLKAHLGERGSMFAIRGGPCELRRLSPVVLQPAITQAATESAEIPDASSLVILDTVRGHIARQIASMLSARPDELRISFEDRDDAVLDTLDAGRVLDIRSLGEGARMPFAVRVYEGDRIITEGTVRANVQRKMRVAIINAPLRRGTTIGRDDLTIKQRWLDVDVAAATPEDIVGKIARTTLDPGEVVLTGQIERPIVIRRGDTVIVDVIIGSVALSVEYRAKEDGAVGDIIEFEHKQDRSRTLQARVQRAGRAASLGDGSQANPMNQQAPGGTP